MDSFKYVVHRSMAQIQQLKFVAQIQNQAQIMFQVSKSEIQGQKRVVDKDMYIN